MVAWYLKTNKPRSKVIVLDANPNIVSKTALFREAWKAYPNIDYRATNRVVAVDPGAREVRTEFDRVKYDVLNLIPPQRAGQIAVDADLVGARQALVRGESRHLRVGEAAERPRDRRRHHRAAGAEVRERRQQHGQDRRHRGGGRSWATSRCRPSPPAIPATAG